MLELWTWTGCAAFVVWPNVYVLAASLVPTGVAIPSTDSVVRSYELSMTPDHILGRVEGVRSTIALMIAPLGPLAAGFLLDATTDRVAIAVFAVFGLVLASWGPWPGDPGRSEPGRDPSAGTVSSMSDVATELTIVPANQASCDDLQAVFGTRGPAATCQCQRYKLRPREAFSKFPVEERAHRLRTQTECGNPDSDTTSGLVAYLDSKPVGWCAVEPRTAYEGLLRVYRVPWEGREEDKADDSVWAVTCVFARAGFRRRGVGYALVRAAVDFARERGARALEGYPMLTKPGEDITWGELNVGTRSVFAEAGFSEVCRPTKRRVVMRIDFRSPEAGHAGATHD